MRDRPNILKCVAKSHDIGELFLKQDWQSCKNVANKLLVAKRLIRPIMSNNTPNTWLLDCWQPNKRRSFVLKF